VQRFAAIADVHGNRWALEAVLEDIAGQGVNDIVNACDHLFGPLDPAGTADLLIRLELSTVAGNRDREILEFADLNLNVAHRDWLTRMPARREIANGILMFHGTPERDDVYLLETVHANGVVSLATSYEIAVRLAGASHNLLLCGHTHIPRTVAAADKLIVNPGSVGLQAYPDDAPVPHVMETGSRHARYAILERCGTGWHVEHRAVDYDFQSAARTAERNGRPDWAWRLRTGRAKP
jgi:predicted phosphodiesterase